MRKKREEIRENENVKEKSSKTIFFLSKSAKKEIFFITPATEKPQKLTKMITKSLKASLIMVMNHELQ
jgi:hypothetical protein